MLLIELFIFSANGEINNAHVEGLSNYVVKHADFKVAKWNVSMGFLWSNIKGKTAYEVDGYIANKLPVYGAGDVRWVYRQNTLFSIQKIIVVYSLFDAIYLKHLQTCYKIYVLFDSFDVSELAFSTQAKLKVNLKTKKVQIVSFTATTISIAKAKVYNVLSGASDGWSSLNR